MRKDKSELDALHKCFLAIALITLRGLGRARKRCLHRHPDLANMITAFTLALVAYLATGLALHFSYVRYFWLMLALAGSASHMADSWAGNGARLVGDRGSTSFS